MQCNMWQNNKQASFKNAADNYDQMMILDSDNYVENFNINKRG